MLGAIIGDIVGSRFEFHNIKSKIFDLFSQSSFFTDDSVMTIAIAKAILDSNNNYDKLDDKAIYWMQEIGRKYPLCGYGGMFNMWVDSKNPKPYNSYGNGSSMRISTVAYVANSLEELKDLTTKVTAVTHNHPEGIKGALATASAIYLARIGKKKEEIRKYITNNYYNLDFKLDEIRDTYTFNETCQKTVPEAIEAFLEANSFIDAIRNAISLGGDSDTIGAITGSIAEAYFGIPKELRERAITYLDNDLLKIVFEFESVYPPKIID